MNIARHLANENPHALRALVHALARPAISARMLAPAIHDERTEPVYFPDDNGLFKRLWFDPNLPLTEDGRNSFDLRVHVHSRSRITFAADPVFTLPWHSERFERALLTLGSESSDHWSADENHLVHLWLPFRIAVVAGGNHSIAAGILTGRGEVDSRDTVDFRALFDHVVCDGEHFIRRHDRRVLAPVTSVEGAAIFEIGRMLAQLEAVSPPVQTVR